jgi:5,10-methylenetetrahydromethanopterin reductase
MHDEAPIPQRPTPAVEFAKSEFCPAFAGPTIATRSEALGFDVQMFADNHTMGPDLFGEIRDAMRVTSRIRFVAGPVNFVTRDPGVIASAVAPLQIIGDGRAICGIARGDSAVAMAGKRPATNRALEDGLRALRTYLHGGTLTFGERVSHVEWMDAFAAAPVPIEMTCSGPRSIAIAAELADRITLSVGFAPERITWALGIVDETLARSGRRRESVRIGVVGPLAIGVERAAAPARLRQRAPAWAHMSSFPGNDLAAQPAIMRRVTENLRQGYDYRFHRRDAPADNANVAAVDEEFADWFGIGGPIPYVIDRFGELVGLGIDAFVVAGIVGAELEAFCAEVMPAVRELRA